MAGKRYSKDEINHIQALINEGLSNRKSLLNWADQRLESEI